MTNGTSNHPVGLALGTAATLTAASFVPILTQWTQLATAVLAFIAAAIALYKAIKK